MQFTSLPACPMQMQWKWRRVGFLWEDGVPYIITNTSWPVGARHHRGLLAAHIMVMVCGLTCYATNRMVAHVCHDCLP